MFSKKYLLLCWKCQGLPKTRVAQDLFKALFHIFPLVSGKLSFFPQTVYCWGSYCWIAILHDPVFCPTPIGSVQRMRCCTVGLMRLMLGDQTTSGKRWPKNLWNITIFFMGISRINMDKYGHFLNSHVKLAEVFFQRPCCGQAFLWKSQSPRRNWAHGQKWEQKSTS